MQNLRTVGKIGGPILKRLYKFRPKFMKFWDEDIPKTFAVKLPLS